MLKTLVQAYKRHEGLRNPAFWVVAVYHIGRWSIEQPWLLRKLGGAVYVILFTWFEFLIGSTLHRETKIGKDFHLIHGTNVRIGPGVIIGDRVGIMHDVTIGTTPGKCGQEVPRIGDDVFIGAGAKILGPVTIGDRAIIGANSLVISDVPAGATAVGVPARALRKTASHKPSEELVHEVPRVAPPPAPTIMSTATATAETSHGHGHSTPTTIAAAHALHLSPRPHDAVVDGATVSPAPADIALTEAAAIAAAPRIDPVS